jgi:hypothetical protein
MSNESGQEIHATVTGSPHPGEEPATTQTGPVGTGDDLTEANGDIRGRHAGDETDDADVIDADAVIIAETGRPGVDGPADPGPELAGSGTATDPTLTRADADTAPGRPAAPTNTVPASPGTDTTQADGPAPGTGSAVPAGDAAHLHDRWTTVQSTFVDDPHASVAAAAELVTEAIETLVSAARERERGLRSEWDHDGVDTEDLRNTLRNYRGFLDHLAAL